MGRVKTWVVVLGLLCIASPLAWGAAPRFHFTPGQVLTYKVSFSAAVRGEVAAQQADVNLQGTATLKTVSVKPDGTAVVEITTTGSGGIVGASDSFQLDNDRASAVTLVVKPNGTIVSATDASGKPYSFLGSEESFMSSAGNVRLEIIGTFTLFGLQLPKALPRAGGGWKGTHAWERFKLTSVDMPSEQELAAAQQDTASAVGLAAKILDPSKMKTWHEKMPVSFTYQGTKKFQGRSCLLFVCHDKNPVTKTAQPMSIYFDAARGQVAGWERHQKLPQGKLDMSIRLASVGTAKATPAAKTPTPAKTAAPTEESPAGEEAPPANQSGSDDDFMPVVR